MGQIMSSKFLGMPLSGALRQGTVIAVGFAALAGCDASQMPGFLQAKDSSATVQETGSFGTGNLVERDIEAPEVFQANEAGLWDGRPSLGGVWVAHPNVKEPERVIIRNEQNGQFVIGALFKRERETPGPRLQVSSDAAAALGVLAGSPANLNVVALRRETVEETPPPAVTPPNMPVTADGLESAPKIEAAALDPITSGAAAAIESAPEPAPAQQPATLTPPTALEKPFIQIGIFSVEQNAKTTATAMKQQGMIPTVKKQTSSGKTFWRVIVGPAQSKSEISTLLKKIKAAGFTDAYTVTN